MKVTQVKSKNGSDKAQIATLRSLGLRRIGHTVEIKDNEQTRGMLHRVRHLVEVSDSSRGTEARPAHAQARPGLAQCAEVHCPRLRRGHGQDRWARPEWSGLARGFED